MTLFPLPLNKIIANSNLQTLMVIFGPCLLNWTYKQFPKRKKCLLIFMNYGVENFTTKRSGKNNNLMLEPYNFMGPMGLGAITFENQF
jgi:hypothetical protein